MRPREKDRDGEPNYSERVAVESEKDPAGLLRWMRVQSEGRIERAEGREDGLARKIGEALCERGQETTTAELARTVGEDPDRGTFKRALAAAEDSGLVRKVKRGRWAPVAQPLDV